MSFLLKFFSKESLFKEILRREGFGSPERELENATVWQEVFHKIPLMKDYLRKREIALLQSSALLDKPSMFVLGQIFENRIWQRFDASPLGGVSKVETSPPKNEVLPKKDFINKWNKK